MSEQTPNPPPGEIEQAYAKYHQALTVAQSRRDELWQLERETLDTKEKARRGEVNAAMLTTLHLMQGRLAELHRLIHEAHTSAREHYTTYITLTEEADGIRRHLKQLELDAGRLEPSSLTTHGVHLGQPHTEWNPYKGLVSDVELTRLALRLHQLVGMKDRE